jgi:hypothetical protein
MPQEVQDLIDRDDVFDIAELVDPRDVRWASDSVEQSFDLDDIEF